MHVLCCIELPTGFFCVSWRLPASHCLTTAIEGDVKCGCKPWPRFNVKLIMTNSTACYWSAKVICFIVSLPKRRALTICHFSYTYCVWIMPNLVLLTATLSCLYNVHTHHMLQFVELAPIKLIHRLTKNRVVGFLHSLLSQCLSKESKGRLAYLFCRIGCIGIYFP